MKAHEIYKNADAQLISEMFQWLRKEEKDLYQQAIATLAVDRKLRPIFVQKKSPADQASWLHKTLRLRTSDGVGEHLFQVYFMKGQQSMLVDFCDGMDIPHDGQGSVEGELPKELDPDKLKTTVDSLLGKNDPKLVTLYLQVFNLQTLKGWQSLRETLANDDRLTLA